MFGPLAGAGTELVSCGRLSAMLGNYRKKLLQNPEGWVDTE